MHEALWQQIKNYNFDEPFSEYGFSTRLANENNWPINFTANTILEYKKFMFLAATSNTMVSPSEIVDVVWHQHLIFSKSYEAFCAILGKNIHHIPSTHNKEDEAQFKQAKENTKKLYQKNFGEQPKEIWEQQNIFKGLEVKHSKYKLSNTLIIIVLLGLFLAFPATIIIEPLLKKINSGAFLFFYALTCGLVFLFLHFYNSYKFNAFFKAISNNSFLKNLSPNELVYLKTNKISNVIHGEVNQYLEKNNFNVSSDNTLFLNLPEKINSAEEFTILACLQSLGTIHYPSLFKLLIIKPVFNNIVNSMAEIKKWIIQTKFFKSLFIKNFIVCFFLFLFGLCRLIIGVSNNRPVGYLFFLLIVLILSTVLFLWFLPSFFSSNTIPKYYTKKYSETDLTTLPWSWKYYLNGISILVPAFLIMANYVNRNQNNTNGSDGGCGTSCGSSCGSSCGGGGGGCGGCGGCGGGD